MINLDIQYSKINHCQKYDMKVMAINQYHRTFVNVWKYFWMGLFSSYKFLNIPININHTQDIAENNMIS